MNGAPVTVDEGGSFLAELNPDVQPKVDIVATDAAGNQNSIHQTITYTDKVPWYEIDPFIAIPSVTTPGTVVTNIQDPKAVPAVADKSGLARTLVQLNLGNNYIWLRFDPPGGQSYYEFYYVLAAVRVDLPRRVNTETLEVPGTTVKGATLVVNGNPVTVDDQGKFTFRLNLEKGDNKVRLDLTTPNGFKKTYTANVRRMQEDFSTIKDGFWPYRIAGWPDGSLLVAAGATPLLVGMTGTGTLQLPVKPGLNQWNILWVLPSGDSGIFRYTYMTPRIVKMQVGNVKGTVNGEAKDAPVAPQLVDSFTYVPLRFLAESLGAKVDWDQATKTATFTLDGTIVSVTLDSADAKVNGDTKSMPAPARLIEGSTLVPLRFISENLGFKVEWDQPTKGITVTGK